MKLKIVSDGTYHGTKITNEHGELVENITALSIFWEAEPNDVARATIEVFMSTCDIEIVGDPKVVCQENKLRIVPTERKLQVEVTTMNQAAHGEKEFIDAD